jgi:hypothetical protein
MERIKSFNEFINESLNEKIMDTKYWTAYNQDTSGGQMPKHHTIWNKDFDKTFKQAVDEWNDEAERESQIKGAQIKQIEKLAMEYFKVEKQISIAVIQAMISQESY